MTILLLAVIYLSFISLGLPDSLLGVTWPIMHKEFAADQSLAGAFSLVISLCTVVSVLFSNKLTAKIGTGKIVAISGTLTALALVATSFISKAYLLALVCIPLGLGAGAVDSSLNDFVAKNYKAMHMSWLHCSWGLGAMIGPAIMSSFIATGNNWRTGYLVVGIIQLGIAVLLFATLPLWKKVQKKKEDGDIEKKVVTKPMPILKTLKKRGVIFSVLAFFFYCSIEVLTSIWGASFLIYVKNASVSAAALWISFYYAGITAGRFLNGLLAIKIKSDTLIRIGFGTLLAGIILIILPFGNAFTIVGFILLGTGCAPIFPSLIHLAPYRFGEEYSSTVIALQMAVAYTGFALTPLLFGAVVKYLSFNLFPFILLAVAFGSFVCTELAAFLTKKKTVTQ